MSLNRFSVTYNNLQGEARRKNGGGDWGRGTPIRRVGGRAKMGRADRECSVFMAAGREESVRCLAGGVNCLEYTEERHQVTYII